MPLFFRSGIPFAVGSLPYSYRPESPPLDIPKLFVQVQVDGKEVEALVDTGAQFFICSPAVARYLGLEDADAVGTERLNIRGTIITGALHRVELTLQADDGEGLSLDVTAFVPQATDEEVLGDKCLSKTIFAYTADFQDVVGCGSMPVLDLKPCRQNGLRADSPGESERSHAIHPKFKPGNDSIIPKNISKQ